MPNPANYPLVDRHVAVSLANLGRPWRVRLEYQNWRENSDKFWEVFGDGKSNITLHFGRNGSAGQYKAVSLNYMWEKVDEKLGKGYTHVRGTATSMSQMPASAPTAPQVAPGPEPLTGPYALIRKVRPVRKGVGGSIDHWDALDAQGTVLLALTQEGASHLLQTYPKQVSVA